MSKRKSTRPSTSKASRPRAPKGQFAIPLPKRRKHDAVEKSTKYYQGGESASPLLQNLQKLFDTYRGEFTLGHHRILLTELDDAVKEPDQIGIEGAQQYLNDLGIELDEVAHFALAELLQCPSVGEFNRSEFVSGWRNVASTTNSCDTSKRQADYINTVIRPKLASDPLYAKQIYRNAFKLAKSEQQRSVPMDSALEFWNLFFTKSKGGMEWNSPTTKWLELWIDFYENQVKRPVNKDLWNMVGELMLKTKQPDGETLSWWTEDGAWPMAVDDFIAFVKAKRGDKMDTST